MAKRLASATFFGLLVMMAIGCGASPRRGGYPPPTGTSGGIASPGTTPPGPVGTQPPGSGPNMADPRAVLEALSRHMAAQRFTPIDAARHGNLAQNQVIAYAFNASPNTCYFVSGLARQGMDLNLYVIDPAGRTIAHDVRPDGHPYASFCPGVAGRIMVRVQFNQGAGDYYYAVFQGAGGSQPNVASFFGQAAEQGPAIAQIDSTTRGRVTALDQRLQAEQYRRLAEPVGLVFRESEARNFPLQLERGACYAFASFGGQGITDSDISLVDGSGNELARDTAVAVDGLIEYCAPQTGAYALRATAYRGQGGVFVAGYVKGQGATPPGGTVISTTTTAGAGLDENFVVLDGEMRARGYEAMAERQRGELPQGQTRDFAISFEGGKCYAILAVGDNGVRNLDLLLLDSRDRSIDRDTQEDPRPIVRFCPEDSGQFKVQVVMQNGAGNFVYAAYRWPRGTRGPFGLRGVTYVRLAEVTALLSVEGYEPDPNYSIGRGQLPREGQSRTQDIELEAGVCYSVLVVGGQGISDIDATLARNGTDLASDGTRNAFPSVRLCTQQAGSYRLTTRAASGSGEYVYQIFRQGAQ